ncbi:MAG: hypothetical protein V3U66_00935 [Acidobacteriota bacterium]
MRHRDETVERAMLPGNRRAEDPRRTVQYVEGSEDRGRQEGWPDPRSQ